jgi:hypothetical protein
MKETVANKFQGTACAFRYAGYIEQNKGGWKLQSQKGNFMVPKGSASKGGKRKGNGNKNQKRNPYSRGEEDYDYEEEDEEANVQFSLAGWRKQIMKNREGR